MQQLHLVGFTTDSDHLILSAKKGAKSGGFVVPLDEQLLEVIAAAVRRRNANGSDDQLVAPPELLPPPEPAKRSSLLSPREIQSRLRAGRTVAQVAAEADADEDWVAKFAPPVLAERARIVARARELLYTRPRRGPSAEPLGVAARWNLADRGVRLIDDEFESCWSAFHVDGLTWGITFEFTARGRRQRAEWEVDFADAELIARNRVAADLGYVEPGRRRRAVSLEPDPPEPRARKAAKAAPPAKKTTPAKKTSPARRAAKASKVTRPARSSKAATKTSSKPATKAARSTKAAKASKTAKVAKAAKSARASRSTKASKSTARSTGSRPRGEPVDAVEVPAVAVVRAPAAGNELSRRRMELVRTQQSQQPPPARSSSARRPTPPPTPAPATRPRPERALDPAPEPKPLSFPTAQPPAPDTAAADDAAAKARREARRRARAERLAREQDLSRQPPRQERLASVAPPPAAPATRALPDDSVIPADDGRVVTIRASRAATGDVVVPGGARPLRPAQPAAQPKRRRFTRTR